MTQRDATYEAARALIADRLGLDVDDHRAADLTRALKRAARALGVSSLPHCLNALAALPDENAAWQSVIADLTIGETHFFRDQPCLDAIRDEILPALIAARRSAGVLTLRLWSAGCATGEEPYTLAILLDLLLPDRDRWSITILGTDVSATALDAARRGVYSRWSLRGVPAALRDGYFRARHSALEIDPAIRRMVDFRVFNLVGPDDAAATPPVNAMDLILCRNVLMYFTPAARQIAVRRLREALLPGGWLVLAAVEGSPELIRPLELVSLPGVFLYRKAPGAVREAAPRPHIDACGVAAFDHQPVQPAVTIPLVQSPPPSPCPSPFEKGGSRGICSNNSVSKSPLAPLFQRGEPERGEPERGEPERGETGRGEAEKGGQEEESEGVLELARALAGLGQLAEARRLCEEAVRRDPLDGAAHFLLAAIHEEAGDSTYARRALERCIYASPDAVLPHFMLGTLLLREGNPARSRRAFETALRLLRGVPDETAVPGGDGMTAGHLAELARAGVARANRAQPRSERRRPAAPAW